MRHFTAKINLSKKYGEAINKNRKHEPEIKLLKIEGKPFLLFGLQKQRKIDNTFQNVIIF